jgi:hypothetical protein
MWHHFYQFFNNLLQYSTQGSAQVQTMLTPRSQAPSTHHRGWKQGKSQIAKQYKDEEGKGKENEPNRGSDLRSVEKVTTTTILTK